MQHFFSVDMNGLFFLKLFESMSETAFPVAYRDTN